MSGANSRQVGGEHYRKVPGEQHWDRLVRLKGLEKARAYFTGTITAYVERYEDKNGIEDLEKARHFMDKLIELEKAAARKVDEAVVAQLEPDDTKGWTSEEILQREG